jgi:hypothetical protein
MREAWEILFPTFLEGVAFATARLSHLGKTRFGHWPDKHMRQAGHPGKEGQRASTP